MIQPHFSSMSAGRPTVGFAPSKRGAVLYVCSSTRVGESAARSLSARGFLPASVGLLFKFNDNRSTERRARNTLTAPALRPLRGVSASGSDRPSKNRGAGLTNRRLSPFNDLCVVQAAHQRHRRVFACVNPGQGSPFNEDRCVEIRHALASKRRKGTRVCRREGMPEGSLAGAVSGSQVHRAMYAGVMSGRSSPFMAKARCAVECSVRFRASATEATQIQTCKA